MTRTIAPISAAIAAMPTMRETWGAMGAIGTVAESTTWS